VEALGAGALLVAAFLAAQALGDRLGGRARRVPLLVLALVGAAAAFELARYDHGWHRALYGVAFVGAPILTIFGGAAAGVRRWYGWPDLGPTPGRLATVSAAILLGFLFGTNAKQADVAATIHRGDTLALAVRAHRTAHDGTWPARLEEATPDVPRTHMGALAPPAFDWDAATHVLGFPVGGGRSARLDLAAAPETAKWTFAP